MSAANRGLLVTVALVCVVCACAPKSGEPGTRSPTTGPGEGEESPPSALESASERGAIAVYDTLEASIDAGTATEADRKRAFELVGALVDDESAGYAFARCGLAGRLAEGRGLKALGRIKEAARWCRVSVERDPSFRDGANRQTLGTIYVLAGDHLDQGDSEEGLEMLESLATQYPKSPSHRLRVAQAYVELGDPDPAIEHICAIRADPSGLRPHEQKLLGDLTKETGAPCSAESGG